MQSGYIYICYHIGNSQIADCRQFEIRQVGGYSILLPLLTSQKIRNIIWLALTFTKSIKPKEYILQVTCDFKLLNDLGKLFIYVLILEPYYMGYKYLSIYDIATPFWINYTDLREEITKIYSLPFKVQSPDIEYIVKHLS